MLVESNHNLTVTVTFELVAEIAGHLLSDAVMVVELAIDDCMDGVVYVVKRLLAVRAQVVDSQTIMADSYSSALAYCIIATHHMLA